MLEKCVGCIDIRMGNFPYGKQNHQYVIDTEGCSVEKSKSGLVDIFFCPVCGDPLTEKRT